MIRPLGFELEDRKLRRAGLDYREWASVRVYERFEDFMADTQPGRLWAFSTHGKTEHYMKADFSGGDALLFGPETRGLPADLLDALPEKQVLRLPMVAGSRSLNLSNSVAVIVYEAWRQSGFTGSV